MDPYNHVVVFILLAHFRDASGTSVSIRGLRLNFCDVDWRPPQTVLARKMLNESVTNAHNEKTKILHLGKLEREEGTHSMMRIFKGCFSQ